MLIKEIIEIKILDMIKRQRSITNPKNWINTFVDLAVIVVHFIFFGGVGGRITLTRLLFYIILFYSLSYTIFFFSFRLLFMGSTIPLTILLQSLHQVNSWPHQVKELYQTMY